MLLHYYHWRHRDAAGGGASHSQAPLWSRAFGRVLCTILTVKKITKLCLEEAYPELEGTEDISS